MQCSSAGWSLKIAGGSKLPRKPQTNKGAHAAPRLQLSRALSGLMARNAYSKHDTFQLLKCKTASRLIEIMTHSSDQHLELLAAG